MEPSTEWDEVARHAWDEADRDVLIRYLKKVEDGLLQLATSKEISQGEHAQALKEALWKFRLCRTYGFPPGLLGNMDWVLHSLALWTSQIEADVPSEERHLLLLALAILAYCAGAIEAPSTRRRQP